MKPFFTKIPGWCCYGAHYKSAVNAASDGAVFVEVGCWKGRSAAEMGYWIQQSGKKIAFYAVDMWGQQEDPYLKDDPDVKSGRLFDVFKKNIAPVARFVKPMRMSSREAADMFPREGVDFIMIDATHTYEAVKADIAAWLPKLKIGGVMMGDDLNWEGVEDAVREMLPGYETLNDGRLWRFEKKGAEERPADVIHFENIEGLTDWNIPRDFWKGRKPGLSAMIRLKNEAEFLEASVESIIGWHDEVLLILQGEQSDDTPLIAEALRRKYPEKIRILEYPFDSLVNGPGHDLQPRGSVYERAYFYNWCLAQTTRTFANKWDGDMVAHDWLGDRVRDLIQTKDGVYFHGHDLVGVKLNRQSKKPKTASELRVHRVTPDTFYFTFTHCEHFSAAALDQHKVLDTETLTEYAYIHLKWCKPSMDKSTVGWPEDAAKKHEYYRAIIEKKSAGKPYRGPYPAAIMPYLEFFA